MFAFLKPWEPWLVWSPTSTTETPQSFNDSFIFNLFSRLIKYRKDLFYFPNNFISFIIKQYKSVRTQVSQLQLQLSSNPLPNRAIHKHVVPGKLITKLAHQTTNVSQALFSQTSRKTRFQKGVKLVVVTGKLTASHLAENVLAYQL